MCVCAQTCSPVLLQLLQTLYSTNMNLLCRQYLLYTYVNGDQHLCQQLPSMGHSSYLCHTLYFCTYIYNVRTSLYTFSFGQAWVPYSPPLSLSLPPSPPPSLSHSLTPSLPLSSFLTHLFVPHLPPSLQPSSLLFSLPLFLDRMPYHIL